MRAIFFLLMIVSLPLKAQLTPNDTVNFNNFDTALFVKCFVELCNEERLNYGKTLNISDIGNNAAAFQTAYFAETGNFQHYQTETFRGLNLKSPLDRLKYYSKGREFYNVGEICSKRSIDKAVTYKSLSKMVYRQYYMSEPHRAIIVSHTDKKMNISGGISISKEKKYIVLNTCFLIFN